MNPGNHYAQSSISIRGLLPKVVSSIHYDWLGEVANIQQLREKLRQELHRASVLNLPGKPTILILTPHACVFETGEAAVAARVSIFSFPSYGSPDSAETPGWTPKLFLAYRIGRSWLAHILNRRGYLLALYHRWLGLVMPPAQLALIALQPLEDPCLAVFFILA